MNQILRKGQMFCFVKSWFSARTVEFQSNSGQSYVHKIDGCPPELWTRKKSPTLQARQVRSQKPYGARQKPEYMHVQAEHKSALYVYSLIGYYEYKSFTNYIADY